MFYHQHRAAHRNFTNQISDARNILVHAFAGEVLDRIRIDAVKTRVETFVYAALEAL